MGRTYSTRSKYYALDILSNIICWTYNLPMDKVKTSFTTCTDDSFALDNTIKPIRCDIYEDLNYILNPKVYANMSKWTRHEHKYREFNAVSFTSKYASLSKYKPCTDLSFEQVNGNTYSFRAGELTVKFNKDIIVLKYVIGLSEKDAVIKRLSLLVDGREMPFVVDTNTYYGNCVTYQNFVKCLNDRRKIW